MPLLVVLLLLQAAPPAAPASASSKTNKSDPNRMICVTEEVTGSRLGSRKRCLTAIQWAEHNRQLRMDVDRYQRLSRPDGGG